jgi:hypothetical protein
MCESVIGKGLKAANQMLTKAECVCAEILLNQEVRSALAIQPDPIAL